MQEIRVQFLGPEDPLEEGRAWLPTPVFLPGKPHGQRSLACYTPWGHKESDMTEAMEQAHTPPPPQTAAGSVEQEVRGRAGETLLGREHLSGEQ